MEAHISLYTQLFPDRTGRSVSFVSINLKVVNEANKKILKTKKAVNQNVYKFKNDKCIFVYVFKKKNIKF